MRNRVTPQVVADRLAALAPRANAAELRRLDPDERARVLAGS
jgi:hypothetical protein